MKSNSLTGKIYDIQPFSVQDGPGIRTTVFLKGCPLHCPWCHSPESQEFSTEICWMEMRCIGTEKCGHCIEACPQGCISRGNIVKVTGQEEKKHLVHIDYSRCIGCGNCVRACLPSALYFCGIDYTVEEVLEKVVKDKPFFERSGGGVTISGGECLCQPQFTLALLKACKEAGLNTAVDTTGFAPWCNIEAILPYTDLFLYDIKHMDSSRHKDVVGVPNEIILENARKIAKNGGKFQIRIPIIPGYNEHEKNMMETGKFLAEMGAAVESVQLLPYHKLGIVKWNRLHRQPPAFEAEPPDDALVAVCKTQLESFGLNVIVH